MSFRIIRCIIVIKYTYRWVVNFLYLYLILERFNFSVYYVVKLRSIIFESFIVDISKVCSYN